MKAHSRMTKQTCRLDHAFKRVNNELIVDTRFILPRINLDLGLDQPFIQSCVAFGTTSWSVYVVFKPSNCEPYLV